MLGAGMADTLTFVRMAAFSVVHDLPQFSPSQPASLPSVNLGHSRGNPSCAPVCAHSAVPADGLRAQGPASSPAKQPS